MKKYIVVYDSNTGMAELNNIGVFMAETPEDAKLKAKAEWRTNTNLWNLHAFDSSELNDGWSYYR